MSGDALTIMLMPRFLNFVSGELSQLTTICQNEGTRAKDFKDQSWTSPDNQPHKWLCKIVAK